MSKERLEEIIERVKRSDRYAEKGLWEASDGMIVHLHNEGDINYLIERVQELEEERERYQSGRNVAVATKMKKDDLEKQNKRYREAINYVMKAKSSHYNNDLDNALDDIKYVINETLRGDKY